MSDAQTHTNRRIEAHYLGGEKTKGRYPLGFSIYKVTTERIDRLRKEGWAIDEALHRSAGEPLPQKLVETVRASLSDLYLYEPLPSHHEEYGIEVLFRADPGEPHPADTHMPLFYWAGVEHTDGYMVKVIKERIDDILHAELGKYLIERYRQVLSHPWPDRMKVEMIQIRTGKPVRSDGTVLG